MAGDAHALARAALAQAVHDAGFPETAKRIERAEAAEVQTWIVLDLLVLLSERASKKGDG